MVTACLNSGYKIPCGVAQNNKLLIQDQVLLTEIKYGGLGYLTLISFSRSLHRLAPMTLLMLAKLFVQKHVILQFRCADNRYIDYSCYTNAELRSLPVEALKPEITVGSAKGVG